jgi:uncharacterized membrane protein HdeD (DUF308 family)
MTVFQPSHDYGSTADRVWPWSMTRGLLAVIFGILGFAWLMPTDAGMRTFAMLVAVFAIADGLANGVDAFRRRDTTMYLRGLAGLVGIAYGVIVLTMSGLSLNELTWYTAIWAFVIGGLEIVCNVMERSAGHIDWIYGLVMGAIAIAFAVVAVIVMPAFSTLMWMLAGSAVLWGIAALIMGGNERTLSHHSG